MKQITNSTDCDGSFIDENRVYLTWNEMDWTTFGNIKSYNVSLREMCTPKDAVKITYLTGMNC